MCSFDVTWEEVYQKTGFGGGYPDTHLVRFVARNLYAKERKTTRILEVGCGVGANLWYLIREGLDTYGIDGSKTAIEKCGANLEKQGLRCKLFVQDACSLKFEGNYFDAIVDIECIYANRLADIQKILREIYRTLKKDGLFFSMMFSKNTWGYGLGKEIEKNTFAEINNRIFGGRGMAHFFTGEEIRGLLSETGFKNIEINVTSRTENNRQHIIEEWLCQAKK